MGLRRHIFTTQLLTLALAGFGSLAGSIVGQRLWSAANSRAEGLDRAVHRLDQVNVHVLQALPSHGNDLPMVPVHALHDRIERDLDRAHSLIQVVGEPAPKSRQAESSGESPGESSGESLPGAIPPLLTKIQLQARALHGQLDRLASQLHRDPSMGQSPEFRAAITNLYADGAISRLRSLSVELDTQRDRLAAQLSISRQALIMYERLELLIPLLATLLAAVAAILIAFNSSRWILKPFDRLNDYLTQLRSVPNFDLEPLVLEGDPPGEITDLTRNVNALIARVQVLMQQLRDLTLVDPLTLVGNRRAFDQTLDAEAGRHRREGRPMALMILDLDHFKDYNDIYGHLDGDSCLMRIGRMLNQHCRRGGDLACRIGGEEFALILPNTTIDEAEELAHQIVAATQTLAIKHSGNPPQELVTVSIGVASGVPSEAITGQWLHDAADRALYCRKLELGRNGVTVAMMP